MRWELRHIPFFVFKSIIVWMLTTELCLRSKLVAKLTDVSCRGLLLFVNVCSAESFGRWHLGLSARLPATAGEHADLCYRP